MIFSTPITFAEALQSLDVRSLLPTNLTSAELERIAKDILERSLFSARLTNAEVLQGADDILGQYIDGQMDLASARVALRQVMVDNGITAAPELAGTIQDFQSFGRLNLILQTNAALAFGYGSFIQGQDPAVLDQFPAQELFRAAPAELPRDWSTRWQNAGGQFPDDRMIARKDDPIWSAISRFGVPYPPFDYNSHMRVRDVNHDDAVALGVIEPDAQIEPQDRGFNDDLQFTPDIRSAAIIQALEEEGYSFSDGVFTL